MGVRLRVATPTAGHMYVDPTGRPFEVVRIGHDATIDIEYLDGETAQRDAHTWQTFACSDLGKAESFGEMDDWMDPGEYDESWQRSLEH